MKRGGQIIENKRFREIAHFAPPMISMRYDRLAKPIVSLCEMNPLAFAGFFASSRPRTKRREIGGGFEACAADVAVVPSRFGQPPAPATRKWRRKPLESLKTDSDKPIRRSAAAGCGNR
jgi:hypothetical protein